MRIWIDATQPGAALRVFSLSLLDRQLKNLQKSEKQLRGLENVERKLGGMVQAERQLRQIAEEHIRPSEIWIELPEGTPRPSDLASDLVDPLPIRWMNQGGTVRQRLQRALVDAAGEPVLAFSADTIVDQRIVEHLAWWSGGSVVYISDEEEMSGAALRLEEPLPDSCDPEHDLLQIGRVAVNTGAAKQLYEEDMDTYIKKLRRELPPYLFRVTDEKSRHEVERFLFASNYKGSTDFLTKWVYPPLVWSLVKPLAARKVHPNWVTSVGIFTCLASIPFFAAGMWVPGMILAYVMSVLDSVDGKLARVTFQSSAQGDVLDHGMDIVHPPFWYMAWAWGLSGGDPYSGLFIASLWMTGFYILDRIMEMLFKSCTGQSIHGYTELDVKMRTVIARRNVFLAVFTVALLLGLGAPAFYLMAAWQGVSLVYHLSRVILFWDDRSAPRASTTPFTAARR
jgi:phosphatidylglycerophosphate synthase